MRDVFIGVFILKVVVFFCGFFLSKGSCFLGVICLVIFGDLVGFREEDTYIFERLVFLVWLCCFLSVICERKRV